MGSKRWMLGNGLGRVLAEHMPGRKRFIDLFSGSGVVSWHVAQTSRCEVIAGDIQTYATVLAAAVIERTAPVDVEVLVSDWLRNGVRSVEQSKAWLSAPPAASLTADLVLKSREYAESVGGLVTARYGGYYLAPRQTLVIDHLLKTVPEGDSNVCLAALVIATSRSVASPGHTAQPFQPTTPGGLTAINHAWGRDIVQLVASALRALSPMHARIRGRAVTGDALSLATQANSADLVFLDPPYSSVQYSRFYHVLETIARGTGGPVSGVGRYTPIMERPQSEFSQRRTALRAMTKLLESLSTAGAGRVIVTFRQDKTSNGLSAGVIREIASKRFKVDDEHVDTRMSTLGGNNVDRAARTQVKESILVLRSR